MRWLNRERVGVRIPAESNQWPTKVILAVTQSNARHVREGNDCLAQYHDSMTEWNITSWCRPPGLPVGQHYKVAMRAHCHKSVFVVMRPYWTIFRPNQWSTNGPSKAVVCAYQKE